MVPTIHSAFIGQNDRHRSRAALLAVALFVLTFGSYAADIFEVSGGVVFLPGHAALVGLVGAAVLGYWRSGLLFGWLAAYASLLGYHADHAFLGIAHRTRLHRVGYFLRPDGLVFLGVEAVIIGTLGWTAGRALRTGVDLLDADSVGQSG